MPVYRIMNRMTGRVIAALKSGGYSAAQRHLSELQGNPDFVTVMKGIYRRVAVEHANRTYEYLRREEKQFGFNQQWAGRTIEYLEKFILQKLTFTVTEAQRDAMLKVLQQGIEKGWGINEMVKQLEVGGIWPPMLRKRIARIVRTEIKRAAEVGAKIASDEFPYEQNKEWISITDKRTRGQKPKDHADHFHLNGQTVDADGVFVDPRNGHKLKFPGDPEAEAEDVINCRCTVGYVAKRDGNGRMIPKRRSTVVLQPRQSQGTTTRRRVSVILPQ